MQQGNQVVKLILNEATTVYGIAHVPSKVHNAHKIQVFYLLATLYIGSHFTINSGSHIAYAWHYQFHY